MTVVAQIARDAGSGEVLDAGPALVEDEDFGYRMANLYPESTGLPMTIWAGPRGGARHDVRIKVCMVPGDVMHWDQLATVGVRPTPRLLHGQLSSRDFARVVEWIDLNREAVVAHWDGETDTIGFARALRSL